MGHTYYIGAKWARELNSFSHRARVFDMMILLATLGNYVVRLPKQETTLTMIMIFTRESFRPLGESLSGPCILVRTPGPISFLPQRTYN